jgi:hypothetical protein
MTASFFSERFRAVWLGSPGAVVGKLDRLRAEKARQEHAEHLAKAA